MHRKALAMLIVMVLWAAAIQSLLVANIRREFKPVDLKAAVQGDDTPLRYTFEIEPDYLLLKISGSAQATDNTDVVFNGRAVSAYMIRVRSEGTRISAYYRIHPDLVAGANVLELTGWTADEWPVKIVVRNYRHSYSNNHVLVLDRPGRDTSPIAGPYRLDVLLSYVFVCLGIFLLRGRRRASLLRVTLIANCLLTIVAANNCLGLLRYVLVIDGSYAVLWLISLGCLIFTVLLLEVFIRLIIPFATTIAHKSVEWQVRERAQRISQKVSKAIVFIIAALAGPLMMLHTMWTNPGMYPIEIFDESSHTYVEVPIVHEALSQGHIQKINFANNFGTPLLGDPVTNPFAPHAWTYMFLKPHIAMIVNKSLFWVLTFTVLFAFYRSRGLSYYAGILTSLLTLTAPAFYWFSQHHPHQGVLFYFTCIVLAAERVHSKPGVFRYLLLHICFIAYLLGCGVVGVLLGVPFVLALVLIISNRSIGAVIRLFVLPLGSAVILTCTHLLYFFRIAGLTWRAGFSWEDVNPYTFTNLLEGCAKLTVRFAYHTDFSINVSVIVLVFSLAGLVAGGAALGRRCNRKLAVFLGLIPFLIVVLMLGFRSLQSAIPFIQSVDMTRVLWFSTVFFMIPLGLLFDSLSQGQCSISAVRRLLYALIPLLVAAGFVLRDEFNMLDQALLVLWPGIILIVYLLLPTGCGRTVSLKAYSVVLFLSLLVPRYESFSVITNNPLVSEATTRYAPMEFVEQMEPYNRLATRDLPPTLDPSASADQKIARYDIFGSGGRSIIANGALRSFLQEHQMISSGEGFRSLLYRLEPNAPENLAKLGIRYFVVQSTDAELMTGLGWTLLCVSDPLDFRPEGSSSQEGGAAADRTLSLFENPLKPSPFYYIEDGRMHFIGDYEFEHDTITIDVPALTDPDREVVATFVAWPGWKGQLNGEPVEFIEDPANFIRVACPQAGRLVLEFSPFCDSCILISVLASVMCVIGCSLISARRCSAHAAGREDDNASI